MQTNDPMLEVYLYENGQLLEQLENFLLEIEDTGYFKSEHVREMFRILHTIKGSSAMMGYDGIAKLSHALEDLFALLRDKGTEGVDIAAVCDMSFSYKDFVQAEMNGLTQGIEPHNDPSRLIERTKTALRALQSGESIQPAANETPAPEKKAEGKEPAAPPAEPEGPPAPGNRPTSEARPVPEEKAAPSESKEPAASAPSEQAAVPEGEKRFEAVVFFEEDCKMENIRSFGILQALEPLCSTIKTVPEDLLSSDSAQIIATNGLKLIMDSASSDDDIGAVIKKQLFIRSLQLSEAARAEAGGAGGPAKASAVASAATVARQSFMSVNVNKLDSLMNLVGEIVIAESTVANNPDALGMESESFSRACQMLNKLTRELQDIVMAIRMVPVATVFHNMRRIVRDMSVKTNKKAELVLVGEETEVDKNIADTLGDPLMHMVRNAMDHGLESEQERIKAGKDPVGHVKLEARNVGNEVLVLVSDDGRGLDRKKLIKKGRERGLISKPDDEISDREAYALVFAPGFSTKDEVTEFSGRGVGMDAAQEILHKIGGALLIDSQPGKGTTFTIRIPLTLAIMQGMLITAHGAEYILPMLSIRESFRPAKKQVFQDPDGNEMVIIRGDCYPVIRLNRQLRLDCPDIAPEDGILVLIEANAGTYCLLVDNLLGEQQVVIKPVPSYLSRMRNWLPHISGCTLMGNGKIQLILDINTMYFMND